MLVRAAELKSHLGQDVTLQGWVYNVRAMGKVSFLFVRDGTGISQCVAARDELDPETYELVKRLSQESSVRVKGKVRPHGNYEDQAELLLEGLEVLGGSEGYPITPKPHGIDFLLSQRHLHLRSRLPTSTLRVRASVIDEIRAFFNRNGFVLVDSPIFTPAAAEGTSTLFEVDYFGEPLYLTQTGQLYAEAACMALERVYCFGPTFRAEKSKTRRHLTEFWMVEPEIAFADLDETIDWAQRLVDAVIQRVLQDHRVDLEVLGRSPEDLERIQLPYHRITHAQAAEILHGPQARQLLERDLESKLLRILEIEKEIEEKEAAREAARKPRQREQLTGQVQQLQTELEELRIEVKNIPHHIELAANFDPKSDLGGSNESVISRLHDRPVFVTHYPRECKAFYMKRNAQDPSRVNNFDLLAPQGYGEIIGGSEREDDLQALLERIAEEKLDVADYDWYLDLRRYGSVPHSGFGMGVERLVAWLCGLSHIRESIPFPRLMGKVYPRKE